MLSFTHLELLIFTGGISVISYYIGYNSGIKKCPQYKNYIITRTLYDQLKKPMVQHQGYSSAPKVDISAAMSSIISRKDTN
jgi:hypothetical protein